MSEIYPTYRARVEQVISGDDIIIMAELTIDDLYKKVRCRLHEVDTPDAYRESSGTKAGTVRDEVRKLVFNSQCSVQVISQGRKDWKVILSIKKGGEWFNLNEHLKKQGYVFRDKSNGSIKKETH